MDKDFKKLPTLFILVMGANSEICEGFTFEDEFNIALQSWAKNLPENIGIVYYDGTSCMKTKFTKYKGLDNVWHLHLACEDSMKYTFKKTWMAYKYIVDKYNPDWIFRTNTSTYVNIDLLNEFVCEIANPYITYGSDLYSLSEACAPYPLCIYPRGNGILTSKKIHTPAIVRNGISFAFQNICDDIVIGNLINTYNINNGMKYFDCIKGLPHAWYKCVDVKFDNGHKLSKFGDDDIDYTKFVTITVKKYREREKEKEYYLELGEKLKDKKCTWDDDMRKYVVDYSVFIGSILGYIDFDKWKSLDKNELFFKQISHKATDDEQHYKYKEIQGYNF